MTQTEIIDEALRTLKDHDWFWFMSDTQHPAYDRATGSEQYYAKLTQAVADAHMAWALRELWNVTADYMAGAVRGHTTRDRYMFNARRGELTAILRPGVAQEKKGMTMTLIRGIYKEGCTIGELFIGGTKICDTLEPVDRLLSASMPLEELRKKKFAGQTAIPTGAYQVRIDIVSPKYANDDSYTFCGGRVPRIMDVPAFDGVLIHIGNFPFDTAGCVLVGDYDGNNTLSHSATTFRALYNQLLQEPDALAIQIERS